jgi:hypothetical protein
MWRNLRVEFASVCVNFRLDLCLLLNNILFCGGYQLRKRRLPLGFLLLTFARKSRLFFISHFSPFSTTMTTLPINDIRSARGSRLGRVLLLATLGLFGTKAAQAQTALNYPVVGATNTAGTYTDLGTDGTVIATANTDDANSAPQPIGFTFNYNGTAYTEFVLNTNGVIRLGNAAPSTASLYYENSLTSTATDPLSSDATAADVNLIMPFNFNLIQGTGGTAEYRVATSGTTGNQVCTIQWKNVSDAPDTNGGATQYANFSFQVKLYENGNIEFVYGTATPSTNASGVRFVTVGLKGAGITTGQLLLAAKSASSLPWSATTFQNRNYGDFSHNTAIAALPDPGRTYRFVPVLPTTVDATVQTYTLGQVGQALASPHAVQAAVTNTGGTALTNVPVTLTVSGASTFTNTQTVASLAPGASTTVTFPSYPLVNGINTVQVVVAAPNDAFARNDTSSVTQTVTADQFDYISAGAATFDGAVGLTGTANIVLANKYTINGPATVTSVTPTFVGTATATNTYQVLLYSANASGEPGAVLYTSPTRIRPAATGSATVSIPSIAVSGSFFVGVKQLTTASIGVGVQDEGPGRTNTFYVSFDNGTTFDDLNGPLVGFNGRLAIGVTLSTNTAPAPANDECATAVALTPAAGGAACTPTNGTVAGATQGAQGPISCGGFISPTSQDVWYSFVAAGTTHTITVTGNFDGVLELLRGTCGSLTNVDCSDAAGNNETLTLTNLTSGTTYFVRYYAAVANPTNGAFTICITAPAPTCAPITSLGVGGIGSTAANVVFTAGTGNTSYSVTYTPQGGTGTTVTSTTPTVALSGLTPNTNYTISVTPICAAGGTATAVTTTFNTLLGTRTALAGGFVSVFPNPAHQSFTVAIPAVSNARQAQVDIINSLGQVVRTQAVSLSANATQATVEAANLAAGIYTVRVKAGNETANVRLTIQ